MWKTIALHFIKVHYHITHFCACVASCWKSYYSHSWNLNELWVTRFNYQMYIVFVIYFRIFYLIPIAIYQWLELFAFSYCWFECLHTIHRPSSFAKYTGCYWDLKIVLPYVENRGESGSFIFPLSCLKSCARTVFPIRFIPFFRDADFCTILWCDWSQRM